MLSCCATNPHHRLSIREATGSHHRRVPTQEVKQWKPGFPGRVPVETINLWLLPFPSLFFESLGLKKHNGGVDVGVAGVVVGIAGLGG